MGGQTIVTIVSRVVHLPSSLHPCMFPSHSHDTLSSYTDVTDLRAD